MTKVVRVTLQDDNGEYWTVDVDNYVLPPGIETAILGKELGRRNVKPVTEVQMEEIDPADDVLNDPRRYNPRANI